MSREIYEQACKLTEKTKVSNRHTFYQLKHFVLGKEITTQAKMQKCIREIEARKNAIKSMIRSLEEGEDDLRIIDLKIATLEKKKAKNELDKEHDEIQKRKIKRKKEALCDSMKEMDQKIKETEEETSFFLSAYQQLEKIEPLKRHDDPEANAEFWNENFSQELQLRILLQKPLDIDLVKCILALDEGSLVRREMIGILEQIERKAIMSKQQSKIGETNG